MQDLINKLTEKVGLNPEQAQGSVETVMEFVKGKLPEGLADKVEDMFGGAEGEKVEMGGIMDSIAGLFGGAGDKAADGAGDIMDNVKDKAGDLLDGATDKLDDLGDAAGDMAKDALGKIKGMFGGDK
jgi:ElaB/YqjD/DUF883 family membrane-anchored ribosome-binding protein